MSYLLLDTYNNSQTRLAAQTITSGSGNFTDDGVGRAILDASGAAWVTNNTRRGDYVVVGGTREVHRWACAAATSIAGGESVKFYNGDDSRSYVLWFTKNGAGAAPATAGEILLGPVNIVTGQTAAQVATTTRAFINSAANQLVTTLYLKDFVPTAGGTGVNVDITNKRPGNCTNSAAFSGGMAGWVFTPATAGTVASANDGVYRVHEVVSETRLLLETAWPSAGIAVAGSATTYVADNRLVCIDEATVTPANIATACNNINIFQLEKSGPQAVTWVYSHYRSHLTVIYAKHTGATNTQFTFERTILINSVGGTGSGGTSFSILAVDPGSVTFVGGREGSDSKSFTHGSFFFNTHWSFRSTDIHQLFGCTTVHAQGPAGSFGFGDGSKMSMCTVHYAANIFGSGGNFDTFNNNIVSMEVGLGFVMANTVDASDNFLLSNTNGAGLLSSTGSFTIEGFDIGGGAVLPVFTLFNDTEPTLLDPAQDFDIDELFQGNAGPGSKSYTFNPRFVFRREGSKIPVPIENLSVSITPMTVEKKFEVTSYHASTTYRTVIDGVTIDVSAAGSVAATATAIAAAINANGTLNTYLTAVVSTDNSAHVIILPDDKISDVTYAISVIGGSGTYTDVSVGSGSPTAYTTDSDGFINSGAGVVLARAVRNLGDNTHYKYQVLVQGGAIKTKRYYYVPRGKMEDDIAFEVASFDLEGELSL
jgi:hypothetical protein